MRPTLPFKRSIQARKTARRQRNLVRMVRCRRRPRKRSRALARARTVTGRPVLSSEASAILRDQLLAELDRIGAQGRSRRLDTPGWPKANTLTPADGDKVRAAFQARLARLQTIPDEDLAASRTRPAGGERRTQLPHRQKRPGPARAQTAKGQTASAVCGQTTLPRLRPRALRPAPSALCAAARAWAKGQRRIYGPALPGASSRTAPRRQGKRLVVEKRS